MANRFNRGDPRREEWNRGSRRGDRAGYRGPDLSGYGPDYDRSRDWPGGLGNYQDYRGLGGERGYYGGMDYDENFGGRDYGLEFDRGYGGGGYPHRGDTGRDYDRGYGARGGRYDYDEGRRYELTFERGYGAWDAVRNRARERGRGRRNRGMRVRQPGGGPEPGRRWGSPDPYRPGQDRTQEWLLRDYDWGRAPDRAREGPHTGRGPQDYQRSSERIEEDANERLTRHGDLDARKIQVRVEGDEITLEGTVTSRRDKRLAEDALETIPGVRDIHNRLRVEQPSGQH